MEFVGIDVKFPITVFIDNVGAMFLENNYRVKIYLHIDIKDQYVLQFIDKVIVKIVLVISKEYKEYLYTRNVNLEGYIDN